jgi:hypothetical protein
MKDNKNNIDNKDNKDNIDNKDNKDNKDNNEYINIEELYKDNLINLYQYDINNNNFIKVAVVDDVINIFDIIIKDNIEINNQNYILYTCLYSNDEIKTIQNNNLFLHIIKLVNKSNNSFFAISILYNNNNNNNKYYIKYIENKMYYKEIKEEMNKENIIERLFDFVKDNI